MLARDPPLFRFDDFDWRQYPPRKMAELRIKNNEIWFHTDAKALAIVSTYSSGYGSWSLSQHATDYLTAALEAGKVDAALVVFAKTDAKFNRTVFRQETLGDVMTVLLGMRQRPGAEDFGPFWTLTEEMVLNIRGGNPRVLGDDEVPF
jgi:hypothetical protein